MRFEIYTFALIILLPILFIIAYVANILSNKAKARINLKLFLQYFKFTPTNNEHLRGLEQSIVDKKMYKLSIKRSNAETKERIYIEKINNDTLDNEPVDLLNEMLNTNKNIVYLAQQDYFEAENVANVFKFNILSYKDYLKSIENLNK